MSFDTADLDRMEADGCLQDVILHEMGHVLGFGTLWSLMDLMDTCIITRTTPVILPPTAVLNVIK
jgi:hypothetical protein